MSFIKFLPIIILLFFLLRFLISFVEKSTISLNEKIIKNQIETGMLSVKDLQKENYDTFIKIINVYLNILSCKEITMLPGGNSTLTNFKCLLNNDPVFISCVQNDLLEDESKAEDKWKLIGKPDLQSFLSNTYLNNCTKGIFITNSTFSAPAIKFIDELNNKNLGIEIQIIDGYELTKLIRNHKYYILKEGLINEIKYNI